MTINPLQEPYELLILLATMAVAQFSPGPDMLLLLKNSFNGTRATALATVAGIVIGLAVHTTMVLTGFAVLFAKWPAAFHSIRFIGAAYLLYLAFKLIQTEWKDWQLRKEVETTKMTCAPILPAEGFRQGLLTNLLNIKAMVFFMSVLSSFFSPEDSTSYRVGVALLILFESWALWSIFVLIIRTETIKRQFLKLKPVINSGFALLLTTISIKIMLDTTST